jgi:hypothetical protein
MAADIGDRLVQSLGGERTEALWSHHLAAEAEAAIDRADMHGLEQDPVRIAVDDALHRRMGKIADRVRPLLRQRIKLGEIRHELPRDRVLRVRGVDESGDGGRDRDRIAFSDAIHNALSIGRDQPGLDEARRVPKWFVDRRHSILSEEEERVHRPKLVPELYCSDFARSLKFYTGVLGFFVRYDRPEQRFAYLERDGAELMIEQTVDPGR